MKAENHTNTNIILPKNENSRILIPFIQTYNRNNPDLFKKTVKPIAESLSLLEPFKFCSFKPIFRQPKSLISILSKNNRKTISGISRCSEPRCKCCDLLETGSTIQFPNSSGIKYFNVKHNINCLSSNLIYKLQCCGCNQFYIGQTGDILRHRMTVHRQQITNSHYSFLRVSKHIAQCGLNNFTVAPFYLLPPNSNRIDREAKEKMFISIFSPALNSN